MATAKQRNHAKAFLKTAAKSDVEYGVALATAAKAEIVVRRARSQVEIALDIVRLGR